MSATTDPGEDLAPGQCGDRHVPDEYREVAGWTLQPHEYVLDNVGDFWGGHRDVVGFVPWEGERYGSPIEDVALVAVERRGDVVWKLQRQHFLGKSYAVNNHPRDRHRDRRESDFEAALDMAREWLRANPVGTAHSLFLPEDPETDDPAERYRRLTPQEATETEYGLISEDEAIALVTDSSAQLPQDETLDDYVVPERVDVGDRFVRVEFDGRLESYAFKHFSVYGFLTGEGAEAPIAPRTTVAPDSGNVAVSFPERDAHFLVAPLDEDVD